MYYYYVVDDVTSRLYKDYVLCVCDMCDVVLWFSIRHITVKCTVHYI